MGALNPRKKARLKRKIRIRKKMFGTAEKPRLSVFRSSSHIYVQIVDDTTGHTLITASTAEKEVREKSDFKSKIEKANYIGKIAGERAIDKGIKKVIFDRNGFLYHGRVKAISDGAREAGLDF
ncbi:MAG: 50S ribosomal protein L18 [Desulfobacteraceae bacterium]|nr:50S ribosomal protein L18 [Desulfobacteraceae bacterium]